MTPQLSLMLAVFLWSTAFVAIRVALQDYTPGSVALFRFFIAGLCLIIPYFRLPKWSKMGLREALLIFLIGPVGMGIYSLLLNQGELQVTAGIASFSVSLTPVFSSLLALWLLKERASPKIFHGLLISCVGLLLIAFADSSNWEYTWALLLIIIAVLCGGIQSISQKLLLKTWSALELVTLAIWFTVLALSQYTGELVNNFFHASTTTTLACIYLGIVPAFIAQWLWSHGLSQMPLINANSYLFMMPLITTLMGWMALGEIPGILGLMGGLIALLGAYISVRQP
jgi:drug/metabolite transporter (DMT)-like permease